MHADSQGTWGGRMSGAGRGPARETGCRTAEASFGALSPRAARARPAVHVSGPILTVFTPYPLSTKACVSYT